MRRCTYLIECHSFPGTPENCLNAVLSLIAGNVVQKYAMRTFCRKGSEYVILLKISVKCSKQFGCRRLPGKLHRTLRIESQFNACGEYHKCFQKLEDDPEGFSESSYQASEGHPERLDSIHRSNTLKAMERRESQHAKGAKKAWKDHVAYVTWRRRAHVRYLKEEIRRCSALQKAMYGYDKILKTPTKHLLMDENIFSGLPHLGIKNMNEFLIPNQSDS